MKLNKVNNSGCLIKQNRQRLQFRTLVMKGSVSLNPKYTPVHIKPTKILKTSPLIACDQKNLYFKSLQKDSIVRSIRWQDKPIINCTYLKKYGVILLLCQNYRVYAMTQNLQEISSLTGWQSKYTLAFEYIEEYGILLMIGAQSVEVMKVSIDTNVKKTKFLSSIKFALKKVSLQPITLVSSLQWNKGYGINVSENLLYVFSPDSVAFFQLSSHELLSESGSLTKKENPITCCYFSTYFKYTLTGTSCGQIRVWRLPLSKKFYHQNVLIHTFEAHVKSIKQIIESKYSQKIILTSGDDLLVCVWSLETFESLRKFKFFGIYNEICVKSIDEAFVFKEGILGELSFGQSLQFITQVNSNILLVDRQVVVNAQHGESSQSGSQLQTSLSHSQPLRLGTISLTLEQNLGLIFDSSLLLKGKDLNKMETKMIYPPLKAKSIKQIISSPFVPTTYFLLAQNGQLFRVVVPPFGKEHYGTSSKIQEAYNIDFTLDREKHPLNQLPSVIGFLDFLPIEFDSEIRDVEDKSTKSYTPKIEHKALTLTQAINKYHQKKLIAIGCEKGTVVFLSCMDMKKIYCRLTYHRQRITSIQCIKEYKSLDFNPMIGMVATFCSENYLKITKFDYEKSIANCILTYDAGEQLKMLRGFNNYMCVVFYKGEFEITQIDLKGKAEEFCCRRSNFPQNHEGEILSIDYEKQNELILTAATDNRIKLWTTKKILLYDVLLDDGLGYCFFVPHLVNRNVRRKQHQSISSISMEKETYENKQNKQPQTSLHNNSIQEKLKQLQSRPKPSPVNFDMIILHGQKLLYFHHIPFSFRPNQIESYNNNPQYLDNYKITLREVFQSYSEKSEEQLESPKTDKNKSSQHYDYQKQRQQNSNKRQKIHTEPSHQYSDRNKYTIKTLTKQQSSITPLMRKIKLKTQTDQTPKLNQLQSRISTTQKKKQKKLTTAFGHPSMSAIKESLYKPGLISQSSIDATKRHIQELQSLKYQINVNKPFLPKINGKKEDIFDQFMRQKLVNKNVLTRRDITINRIIMKNIIKEHFADQTKVGSLKLQY